VTARFDPIVEPAIRAALRQAWQDSQPGLPGAHEEGGFVLREPSGKIYVMRWPSGAQNTIVVPPHPGCRIGTDEIIASFHTHPNTGPAFLQEPSETDCRAVRDDPDLKGTAYSGEWIISEATVYLIAPSGQVTVVGGTPDIIGAT
jgi:hypothetical protein